MGGALSQFTGSGITIGTLTSSAAISIATLNNYDISQNAERMSTDIASMKHSPGTEGNSFQKNVNLYLHQRQEHIITYSHKLNGYDYVYIKPSDLYIRGPQTVLGYEKYPGATIIPAGRAAFAEFRIPKNAQIYSGNSEALRPDIEVSASSAYLTKMTYEMSVIPQHRFNGKASKAHLQSNAFGDTAIFVKGTFNNADGLFLQKGINPANLIGKDSQHFILTLPSGSALPLQSEKIFYGARLPIRMQ